MDAFITVTAIGLFALFLVWIYWRQVAVSGRLIAFCLAFLTGCLFRLIGVESVIYQLTHLNNISWLIRSAAFTICIYVLVIWVLSSFRVKPPNWTRPLFLATLGGYLFLYVTYISQWPNQHFAFNLIVTDWGIWLGSVLLLGYSAVMMMIPTWTFYHLHRQEAIVTTRWRWGIAIFSCSAACVLFISRMMVMTFGFYAYFPQPLYTLLYGLMLTSQALTLIWFILFLPESRLDQLATLWTQMLMLRNLTYLQRCLQAVGGETIMEPAHWWKQQPDMALYQHFIAILDASASLPTQSEKARTLSQQIAGCLSDDTSNPVVADYYHQLQAYSRLGSHLRKARFLR